MLFTKLFTVTINVRNPIGFCADKMRQAMIHLKSTYERRCYMGSFIVAINKIEEISSCRIINTNNSGEGVVDVQFSATVGSLARWDIYPGAKILRTDLLVGGETSPDMVKADPARRDVRDIGVILTLISSAETTKLVRAGQTVCVRVVGVEHKPMQPGVSVAGQLLTCERATPVYRVRGNLTTTAALEMMPIIVAIDAELAQRKKAFDKAPGGFMFFEGLLYSYARKSSERESIKSNVAEAWEGPKRLPFTTEAAKAAAELESKAEAKLESKVEAVNILDIVRAAAAGKPQPFEGVWSRPLTLCRSSPLVARRSAAAPVEETKGTEIIETPAVVCHVFLKSILEFLTAVRCMTEIYNSEKMLKEHQNIWLAMKSAQILLSQP
jgi:hypothetical protein